MHGKKLCEISKVISQEAFHLLPRTPRVLFLGEASNSAKKSNNLEIAILKREGEEKIDEQGAARVDSATPASLSHSPGVTHVSE